MTPGQRCYEAWATEVRGTGLRHFESPVTVDNAHKESPWVALGGREQAAWEKVAAAAQMPTPRSCSGCGAQSGTEHHAHCVGSFD
jgi:hypothetical protein